MPCRSPASASRGLEVVDLPEPEAGPGQTLYNISTAGVNYADTHQRRDALPESVRQQPLDHPTREPTG